MPFIVAIALLAITLWAVMSAVKGDFGPMTLITKGIMLGAIILAILLLLRSAQGQSQGRKIATAIGVALCVYAAFNLGAIQEFLVWPLR